jgi:hypothetical protein
MAIALMARQWLNMVGPFALTDMVSVWEEDGEHFADNGRELYKMDIKSGAWLTVPRPDDKEQRDAIDTQR